ncbi:MAG: DUF4230 domain-containing protein [Lentisphaerota bacterium]
MELLLMGSVIGLLLAFFILLLAFVKANRSRAKKNDHSFFLSIEELRSIGELSVFKVVTKEIVTAKDHWLGTVGKKYFEWLSSSKKMAMIFEFDINFQYNLRDAAFEVKDEGPDGFRISMPQCTYELHIRDITFYDEQKARFLPWLIPDLLTSVFGSGFNEEDRNRLKQEARTQAESLALNLVKRLRSEVQSSARETMEMLARGFSAQKVVVVFKDTEPAQVKVDYTET